MRALLAFCICSFAAVANPSDPISLPNRLPQSIKGREEALFLRRIASFWEEGEYTIAKHQMEEFLTIFPTSEYADTLRVTLGDLFVREKSFQEALNHYAQITNAVLEDRVFIRRMQCMYHLQWHATLADECEKYLQSENKSEKKEAIYLLAIALYEQCIHAPSDAEAQAIAQRAKPYFETLSNLQLSSEVARALAHLHYILKDFEGSAQIYLNLAKNADQPEELLFQAALLQSKYNQALSIQTFGKIADSGGKLSKDAAYNQLLIYFDAGLHEEIVLDRERILQTTPPEKQAIIHSILGQSFLVLNQWKQAGLEFDAFMQSDVSTQSIFLHVIEVAYRIDDLALLDRGIEKWTQLDAKDPNLATASLTRAQILKKQGSLEDARKEISTLLTRFPEFTNRPEAAFSLIQLEASAQRWDACRDAALFFIHQYPSHTLASNAWQHLTFASTELCKQSPELRNQLVQDLEYFLSKATFLSPAETCDMQFSLAKVYFELGLFQESINLLEPLCGMEYGTFETQANAELLLALAFQYGLKDLSLFCYWAEQALQHKATLLLTADQHLALFNAYIIHQPEAQETIAHHLTQAYLQKATIELPNLLWLANYTYEQFIQDPSVAELAENVIIHILSRPDVDPKNIQAETVYLEPIILHHAKLLQHLNQPKTAQNWLESLEMSYQTSPELNWHYMAETRVLLAESLVAEGSSQLALALFDTVASSTILRDRFAATAALQSARIKQTLPDANLEHILTLFKNIFLQKNLANEPIHLESALDYVELSTRLQPPEKQKAKHLDLLIKTKAHFDAQNDLLSKDYHEARKQNLEQNQIYLNYMHYMNANILLLRAELEKDLEQQKELKANAEKLLLQMAGKPSLYLQRRLEQLYRALLDLGNSGEPPNSPNLTAHGITAHDIEAGA